MFRNPLATIVTCTAIGAAALFGLAQDAQAQGLQGEIKIDGSSTVYPITEAVAEEFRKEYPKVRITVGISGTGGGFKRFTVGETDISDASRPIKDKEYKVAIENKIGFIEIPVAYDGLTIVLNKGNDFVKQMTVDDLKKIFLDTPDKAKTWKDVNASYPDKPIKIFAPGTDSGTFDYFKEVVAGKDDAIRADMQVSEDDNVLVNGVVGEEGAIGFFGAAYYFENEDKLRAVPIVNDEGKAIIPSATSIEDGSYNPFSRPLFIYVAKNSARRPEVRSFIEFYFEKGPSLAEEVGYVRLPSEIYDNGKHNFKRGKAGTQYLDKEMNKVEGPVTKVYKKL